MGIRDTILAAQAGEKRLDVTVERWGGETLYFRRLTTRDVDNISRKYPKFFIEPSMTMLVDVLIDRAETVDGEKLFTRDDKSMLMSEPAEVIDSIARSMVLKTAEPAEEIEKN